MLSGSNTAFAWWGRSAESIRKERAELDRLKTFAEKFKQKNKNEENKNEEEEDIFKTFIIPQIQKLVKTDEGLELVSMFDSSYNKEFEVYAEAIEMRELCQQIDFEQSKKSLEALLYTFNIDYAGCVKKQNITERCIKKYNENIVASLLPLMDRYLHLKNIQEVDDKDVKNFLHYMALASLGYYKENHFHCSYPDVPLYKKLRKVL